MDFKSCLLNPDCIQISYTLKSIYVVIKLHQVSGYPNYDDAITEGVSLGFVFKWLTDLPVIESKHVKMFKSEVTLEEQICKSTFVKILCYSFSLYFGVKPLTRHECAFRIVQLTTA